jgi:hypothetical protein
MAIAPTLTSSLDLGSASFSELSKIFAMIHGGYKVEPIWMVNHIDLANLQWKNKCFYILFMVTKDTCFTSVPITFYKVIYSKNYTSTKKTIRKF